MHSSRRRTRRKDPLASPEAVRHVMDQLRRKCPNILPSVEKQAMKMLESVRHYMLNPSVNESRGRPRRWPREDVAEVAENLRDILERKIGGRLSTSSFVSMYLPILRYPVDVTDALSANEINIREAAYLALLTPEKLECTTREAQQMRTGILKAHLQTKGSQESLRQRTKVALGLQSEVKPLQMKSGKQMADELIKKNAYDARHLFYEELQRLTEAMRQIEPNDLKGEALDAFLRQIGKLLNMLHRANKRSRLQAKKGRAKYTAIQ
jgi:hypothetical protein